jgi:hypothetical protein
MARFDGIVIASLAPAFGRPCWMKRISLALRFGARFGFSARGRSLVDAVKLVRELDPGRFDDLDLRQERQRSGACSLGFCICKAPSPVNELRWRRAWM